MNSKNVHKVTACILTWVQFWNFLEKPNWVVESGNVNYSEWIFFQKLHGGKFHKESDLKNTLPLFELKLFRLFSLKQ